MPDHDHKDYATASSVICQKCGKPYETCAYCNDVWHKCPAGNLLPGYRVVEEFPDYMVNRQATIRQIKTHRYCVLVRVSNSGGAMINLMRNGKKYTRAAQDLRDAAFPVKTE